MRLGTGNEAVIDAALASGCKLFAGYPVTPATEILETAAVRFPPADRVFIPAESEIAAIHMLAGAAAAGHRAMTATSGMGVSLMAEALSYFSGMCELPGVVVSQQRWGPGDGSLGPGQDSYHQATRGAGHGDFRMIVLAPAGVQETADLVGLAFELADRYRLFVIVLGDHLTALTSELYEVAPPLNPVKADASFCESQAENGKYVLMPELLSVDTKGGEFGLIAGLARRWEDKYRTIEATEARFELEPTPISVEVLVVAYGSLARVAQAAVPLLAANGVVAKVFRPITLWPFPETALAKAAEGAQSVVAAELSMGQMVDDVRLSLGGRPHLFVNWLGGESPSPRSFADAVLDRLEPAGQAEVT